MQKVMLAAGLKSLLLLPGVIRAWDADGYAAVGMTTMSALEPEALTQLKRLLSGKDVVDVSHWTFSLRKKFPEMSVLFQQSQDRDLNSAPSDCSVLDFSSCRGDGHCLTSAVIYFYKRLTRDTASIEERNESVNFRLPSPNIKLSDTDCLKILVGLLADLHSPSRFGYNANRLGQDTQINYMDNSDVKSTTLFQYWDSDLIQKTIRDRPHFWFSGWTHAQGYHRGFLPSERQQWNITEDKTILFEKWASETWSVSCTRLQRIREVLKSDSLEGAESDILVKPGTTYNAGMVFMDFELLRSRILIAGIRSAIVLNSVLNSIQGRSLRSGSGVRVPVDRPMSASGIWSAQRITDEGLFRWARNLSINASIILVVVGVFALFIKYSSEEREATRTLGGAVQMANKVKD